MKTLAIAAVMSLLSVYANAAEGKQDFKLINKTGYEIDQVFVAPSASDDWEEDVLGKDSLDDGEAWNIHFSRAARPCKWDIKVVYTDDSSSAVWKSVDLCEISSITIRYNRKTDTTSANFD